MAGDASRGPSYGRVQLPRALPRHRPTLGLRPSWTSRGSLPLPSAGRAQRATASGRGDHARRSARRVRSMDRRRDSIDQRLAQGSGRRATIPGAAGRSVRPEGQSFDVSIEGEHSIQDSSLSTLTDEEFQEMCDRLVRLEFPDARSTAVPDGGADSILVNPDGGFQRAWQAKRFTGTIHWESLELFVAAGGVVAAGEQPEARVHFRTSIVGAARGRSTLGGRGISSPAIAPATALRPLTRARSPRPAASPRRPRAARRRRSARRRRASPCSTDRPPRASALRCRRPPAPGSR